MVENADRRCDRGENSEGCNFKWAGQGLIEKMRFELTSADLKEVRELAIWISERSFIGREDSQYKVLKVAVCLLHLRNSWNPLCLEQSSETKRNRRWDQRNNRAQITWTLWASLWTLVFTLSEMGNICRHLNREWYDLTSILQDHFGCHVEDRLYRL